MRGSSKSRSPLEFRDWLKLESEDWKPTYADLSGSVKQALISVLFEEQKGLCVYCGRKMVMTYPGKTFHIEHYQPQATFPDLQLVHENLYLSCGQQDDAGKPSPSCGNVKGNWFDEESHIYPAYNACTQRFKFSLNGTVEPANLDDQSANIMIEVLNLNHPELVKDREAILFSIDAEALDIDDFIQVDGIAESYAHVVFQHLNKILP